jgi:hypothetical protein
MFLSEWREFPSAPCLAKKKKCWQLATRCCWNRALPWHASELVSFLVELRTYQHPGITGSAGCFLTRSVATVRKLSYKVQFPKLFYLVTPADCTVSSRYRPQVRFLIKWHLTTLSEQNPSDSQPRFCFSVPPSAAVPVSKLRYLHVLHQSCFQTHFRLVVHRLFTLDACI